MPTATIDKEGSQIYFVDTGPVIGSDNYTTLFMYHGTSFNGATFKKLIPLAPKANIRLVLVNRRNYNGSTPSSTSDIESLYAGRKVVLDRMALDVAGLLNWFLDHNEIPHISDDGTSGGLCLLGWSMGGATVLAFLGQPDLVGHETYARLEPYLRRLVIYDSPVHALGFEIPEQVYYPFISAATRNSPELIRAFALWVGTHYSHPGDMDTNDISALDTQSKHGVRPHIDTLSEEDKEGMVQFESAKNDIGLALFGEMLKTVLEQTNKVLFDEYHARTVCPRLKVVHYVCLETPWSPLYAVMVVRKKRDELIKEGKTIRPYVVAKLPGGNHFAHWEAPESFFNKLVEALAV